MPMSFAPRRALEIVIFKSIVDLLLLPGNTISNTYRMSVMMNLIVKLSSYLVQMKDKITKIGHGINRSYCP